MKLDYALAQIQMHAANDIEREYRLKACAKEPWTVEWIESMPAGSVLYDVGANVGSYSLLAAALGHTVVAFEPAFANYNRLCENIILNGLEPKVIPLCIALGNESGMLLIEQELQPGFSGGTKRLRVPMMTLADATVIFGLPTPTHIKVDVDGSEEDVVQGWMHHGVSWLVEVQTGHERALIRYFGEPDMVHDQRNGQRIQGMSMMQWGVKQLMPQLT